MNAHLMQVKHKVQVGKFRNAFNDLPTRNVLRLPNGYTGKVAAATGVTPPVRFFLKLAVGSLVK